SPSRNAFYPSSMKSEYMRAGTWPDDAVVATEEEWREYGAKRPPSGMQRGPDDHGRPGWVAIPDIPLDQLAKQKLSEINAAANKALADIRRDYPQFEIDTWGDQEREARAWAADNSVETPTLSGIAAERGVTVAELAPKVITKANIYRPMATAVIGKRQRLEDVIKAAQEAEDRDAIEAISW
ncbi:hypothetical protein SAMN05216571_106166, partial [Onishia taeanensis]